MNTLFSKFCVEEYIQHGKSIYINDQRIALDVLKQCEEKQIHVGRCSMSGFNSIFLECNARSLFHMFDLPNIQSKDFIKETILNSLTSFYKLQKKSKQNPFNPEFVLNENNILEIFIKSLSTKIIKLQSSIITNNIQVLYINEISKISAWTFEFFNYFLQIQRKSNNLFGGITLILNGDLFDLGTYHCKIDSLTIDDISTITQLNGQFKFLQIANEMISFINRNMQKMCVESPLWNNIKCLYCCSPNEQRNEEEIHFQNVMGKLMLYQNLNSEDKTKLQEQKLKTKNFILIANEKKRIKEYNEQQKQLLIKKKYRTFDYNFPIFSQKDGQHAHLLYYELIQNAKELLGLDYADKKQQFIIGERVTLMTNVTLEKENYYCGDTGTIIDFQIIPLLDDENILLKLPTIALLKKNKKFEPSKIIGPVVLFDRTKEKILICLKSYFLEMYQSFASICVFPIITSFALNVKHVKLIQPLNNNYFLIDYDNLNWITSTLYIILSKVKSFNQIQFLNNFNGDYKMNQSFIDFYQNSQKIQFTTIPKWNHFIKKVQCSTSATMLENIFLLESKLSRKRKLNQIEEIKDENEKEKENEKEIEIEKEFIIQKDSVSQEEDDFLLKLLNDIDVKTKKRFRLQKKDLE